MKLSTGVRSIFSTLILLGLVLGLQACGGSSGTSNSAPTASSLNIVDDNGGSFVVGDSLTGNYTYADANSDVEATSTYRWLRGGVVISGAISINYTLVTADIGQSISFEVTPIAATGTTTGSLVVSSTIVLNANPTGYYTGSAAVKESDNTTDLAITDIQILINGSRLMIMSDAQVVVYDGQMSITANDFTSTADIYKNGINTGTATIAGTITEGSQITGTFTGTGLGNGTFTSTYSNLNNTASAAATIETASTSNIWACDVNEGVDTMQLDIDSSGVVATAAEMFGTIFQDCQVDGTVTPITGTGLYLINISTINNGCATTAAESANTGVYTGFAITKTNTNLNDRLVFTMTNGTYSTGDDCRFQ